MQMNLIRELHISHQRIVRGILAVVYWLNVSGINTVPDDKPIYPDQAVFKRDHIQLLTIRLSK